MLKKILLGVGVVVGLMLAGGSIVAGTQIMAFNSSISKVYEVPPPEVRASTDPEVLARGKHLAESIGGCMGCHGSDLAHGKLEEMGPVGRLQAPNLTSGRNGVAGQYSDGELARVIRHGVRKDGTGVTFMPSHEFSWWPDSDLVAVVSYLRTLPPVDTEPNVMEVGALGKILDRFDLLPLDPARRIDHQNLPKAPAPGINAEYGSFLVTMCQGCHGKELSGGPIPGAPPELPVPANLTPHETGLKDWTYADFERLMRAGVRKNGTPVNPFMPMEVMKNMNDTELGAMWAYLQTLPPRPFGNR